jgi:hypothetical protein
MSPDRVEDAVAEKLEAAGLWRRAKARWLEVMQSAGLTESQRLWIRQRRELCQTQITPVIAPEKLDINELSKAASAAQVRMGIAQVGGAMFRAFPSGVKIKEK